MSGHHRLSEVSGKERNFCPNPALNAGVITYIKSRHFNEYPCLLCINISVVIIRYIFNKTDNARINITLRRVRLITVAVEKQGV